jgi:hypothetical protein
MLLSLGQAAYDTYNAQGLALILTDGRLGILITDTSDYKVGTCVSLLG